MNLQTRVSRIEKQHAADVKARLDSILEAFWQRSREVMTEAERAHLSDYFGRLARNGDAAETPEERHVVDLLDTDDVLAGLLNRAAWVLESSGQNCTKLDKWKE